MTRGSALMTLVLLSVLPPTRAAANPIIWSGNGHQYSVVSAPALTWDEASSAVEAMFGTGWYLATITGPQEQSVIDILNLSGIEYWVGGSQPLLSVPADSGWAWVTGEPFAFSNWAPGEPNDWFGPASEQHLGIWGTAAGFGSPAPGFPPVIPRPRGTWNDEEAALFQISGYIAEGPAPVPEPASLTLLGLGLAGMGARRWRQRKRS